jgi:hypothetical protein
MSTLLEYLLADDSRLVSTHTPLSTLNSPLILYDLRRSVADGTTRSLGNFIPDDFRQAKVCELDDTDASPADSWPEFAFVLLFFVVWAMNRVLGRDDGYALE